MDGYFLSSLLVSLLRCRTQRLHVDKKTLFAAPAKLLLCGHNRQTAKHSSQLMIMVLLGKGKHNSAVFLFCLPCHVCSLFRSLTPSFSFFRSPLGPLPVNTFGAARRETEVNYNLKKINK